MKKKEMKELAKRIAKAELAIRNGSNEEVAEAKNEIFALNERLTSTDDILAVDEMVQEILSQKI